ncbi:hypothetical protein SSP35_01_09060 [Streptomyces sp. NBRC 110611]|nr:hypothetical protein SSP35_01_09060 [Streptomyces sp. NBRC 110611]
MAQRLLANAVRQTRPGELIAQAVKLRELADTLVERAVVAERSLNTSWEAVGQELGVTKSTAHTRYSAATTSAQRELPPGEDLGACALQALEETWDDVRKMTRNRIVQRMLRSWTGKKLTSEEIVQQVHDLAAQFYTDRRLGSASSSEVERRFREAQQDDRPLLKLGNFYRTTTDETASVAETGSPDTPLNVQRRSHSTSSASPGLIAELEGRIAHLEAQMGDVIRRLEGTADYRLQLLMDLEEPERPSNQTGRREPPLRTRPPRTTPSTRRELRGRE